MALTEQQAAAIERLRENESLTGNLTDKPAMAVLAWAEERIKASAVYEDVVAAVRAANRTGTEDVDEALSAAQKSLDAAIVARGALAATPPGVPATVAPPPAPPALPVPPIGSPIVSKPPAKPQTGGQKKSSKRKSSSNRQ